MKRGLVFILLLAFVILTASCGRTEIKKIEPSADVKVVDDNKQQAPPASVISEDSTKGVTLLYNRDLDLEHFRDLGFNRTFLSVNGIRISKPPYKTDFKLVRSFKRVVKNFENENMNYIINICSGPGYSVDGSIVSLFNNRQEAMYYAQMVKETIKLHYEDPRFNGISLYFENPNIPEDKYYNTLSYITSKVREEYPDVNLIVSLHPLSFEMGMENITRINLNNVTLNANINLRAISYPGTGVGYKSSFKINRNSILSSLQILKDNLSKNNSNVIVTIKIPWSDKSDVFLQDIFEIIRMLDFNFNIACGNSQDVYDFKNTDPILKVVKRHSK